MFRKLFNVVAFVFLALGMFQGTIFAEEKSLMKYGYLTVLTDDPSSEIFVNSIQRAKGKLDLYRVPEGENSITVRLNEEVIYNRQVTVSANETTTVFASKASKEQNK
jgi:hypothetical protein